MHVYIYNILGICAYLQGICESLDLSWFPMQIPRYCYLLCEQLRHTTGRTIFFTAGCGSRCLQALWDPWNDLCDRTE